MRRLKIGIGPQLMILVGFSSLLSLLILSLSTAVYFSNKLSNTRAEKLEGITQLKSTQVKQSIDNLYYQIYWLASKDSVSSALSSYRAGNNSESVFEEAETIISQFLTSSDLFAAARLYNLDLDVMVEGHNNFLNISNSTMEYLYPFSHNNTKSIALVSLYYYQERAYFTGPKSNISSTSNTYFMGLTLPVYSNSSILLSEPSISGYLSVIASTQSIQLAINTTTAIYSNGDNEGYIVVAVNPILDSIDYYSPSRGNIIGFETLFPDDHLLSGVVNNINSSSAVKEALSKDFGFSSEVKTSSGKPVAIGFSRIGLDHFTNWTVIVGQPRSVFLRPVQKLANIIIGVVLGIGAFMCLITFPLAVWFIRPITQLKEATEAITKSKKQKDLFSEKSPSFSPPPSAPYGTLSNNNSSPNKRISLSSANSNNSNSIYSTGIRLPSSIPVSKKFFKDEFTELTEAFNIMTEELDKQYTHLEDRVKLRTKELEASKIEAEAANEAKTVFIANISHELRTPLNGILGMTSIAMDEEDSSNIKESLKLIHRSGELLLHILTELLTYSKNTLNRSKLEKSNFEILEIVDQVKSIFHKLAIDQRVNFKILVKPNILRKLKLYGDSNRIIQIVMNLVSNSLKFTPVDGSVSVTFRMLGEYDYEKSKEAGFKNVHVLKENFEKSPNSTNGTSTLTNNSNPNHSQANDTLNSKNDAIVKPAHNQGYKNLKRSNEDGLSSTKASNNNILKESISNDSFLLDNDNISLFTLSTSEYENKIFQEQFKSIDQVSKLPDTPSTSSSSSSIEPKGTSSLIDKELSTNESRKEDTTYDTANDKLITESDNKIEAIARSYSTLLPRTFNIETSDRKPICSSSDSNHPRNEIIKNNKVFKIRNLYKPTTWVIQIEVTDTGPGIEPALQEKVFEPFIQGDQSLSRSYGGTGLGLSICRQLANMMKGTLTLKSSIGQGSTFTFTVPLPQTGEIMVNDDDMVEFCDDEFNPKSKINRKVLFKNFDDKTINEKKNSMQASNDDDISSENNEVSNSTGDNKELKIEIDRPAVQDASLNSDASIPNSAQNSNPTASKSKFEVSKQAILEKPHLLTRSSTGTANSSSTNNEKLDLHHSLLDSLSYIKILVAEDNMVNQEVIKRMLKLEGLHNIDMACNGAEAVELVKESIEKFDPFDIIFMDVQMPKIDGLLATKMIRNNLQYKKPIIALTAFADESNMKECLNSGMSGFLAKPIRRTNLRKIITEFSPVLLSEIVTTPQTQHSDDKRLGYDNTLIDNSPSITNE